MPQPTTLFVNLKTDTSVAAVLLDHADRATTIASDDRANTDRYDWADFADAGYTTIVDLTTGTTYRVGEDFCACGETEMLDDRGRCLECVQQADEARREAAIGDRWGDR